MHRLISILILSLFNVSITSLVHAEENGVNVDLIYRDSPLSPLYNHSITQSELTRKAALRDIFFPSSMHIDEKDIESDLIHRADNYLMRFYIGKPPVEITAMVHLADDFTWIQCFPCPECNIDQEDLLFFPNMSSTYHKVSYTNDYCRALPNARSSPSNNCEYKHIYKMGAHTSGYLGNDTLHIEQSAKGGGGVAFHETIFGCGHDNQLLPNNFIQGMVGLGRGKLSLIRQMNAKNINIQYKFSYCLVPVLLTSTHTSRLRFGSRDKIPETEVSVSVPLKDERSKTTSFVSFASIRFGDMEVRVEDGPREISIDFSKTFSYLYAKTYDKLEIIVKEVINEETSIAEEPPHPFKLCYEQKCLADKLHLLEMVFHFTEEGRIHLKHINIFQSYENLYCMAILPARGGEDNVLGSIAQVNFQVEFNLQEKKVSFAEADCTKISS